MVANAMPACARWELPVLARFGTEADAAEQIGKSSARLGREDSRSERFVGPEPRTQRRGVSGRRPRGAACAARTTRRSRRHATCPYLPPAPETRLGGAREEI